MTHNLVKLGNIIIRLDYIDKIIEVDESRCNLIDISSSVDYTVNMSLEKVYEILQEARRDF